MGKIQLATTGQKIILDEVRKNNFLASRFYFTGETALSSVYLHHRESDDLDFFSLEPFDNQVIFTLMQGFANKHQFTFSANFVEVVYIFFLDFANNQKLKVDFSVYPYSKLEKELVIDNLRIDSLFDIAVNKLLTVSQRSEVKDFVDLYFLLKKFSLWDLISGVTAKFRIEFDTIILASDFLKVEDFDVLPKMLQPLSLNSLKSFFRTKAKDLGIKVVI